MAFTIRFYTVGRMNPNGLSLHQALTEISSVEDRTARERVLTSGLTVRLERFSEDGDELAGEFTRVRDTNFPFEVKSDGVGSLQTDGPIGNGVAFRFRPADHTLAIQYDTQIVSPGRARDYLLQCNSRAAFDISPKMDTENWRKFQQSPVRKLRIGIASPNHLGAVEDEGAAVKNAFQNLGEAYSAPVITIEMGMGRRSGSLSESIKRAAAQFSDDYQDGRAELRSLKAKIKPADGVPTEEINLIDELISVKFDLTLPKNDPETHYQVRNNYLREKLRGHGD